MLRMPRSTGSYGLLTAFGEASTENARSKNLTYAERDENTIYRSLSAPS
jgi:hypothetical protein